MAEENPPRSVPEAGKESSADSSPLADRDRTAPVRRSFQAPQKHRDSGRRSWWWLSAACSCGAT